MITGVWGYTYTGSCVQNCTGIPNGEKVLDPKYCNTYFECYNGEPYKRVCGALTYFEPVNQVCQGPTCPPSNQNRCSPSCKFDCQDYQPSAHRSDCTKYYVCDPEGMIERSCTDPTKPFWDGAQCQEVEENCCDPCIAYCSKEGTRIADPFNCQQYYDCTDDDYFPRTFQAISCYPGTYFSVAEGMCSSDSSCLQVCDAVGAVCPQFQCPTDGYGAYPVCNNRCCELYYNCDYFGMTVDSCNPGLVFDPDNGVCVTEEECPYPYFPCSP